MARRHLTDLHLGHENILKMSGDGTMEKRKKFHDISEMNISYASGMNMWSRTMMYGSEATYHIARK